MVQAAALRLSGAQQTPLEHKRDEADQFGQQTHPNDPIPQPGDRNSVRSEIPLMNKFPPLASVTGHIGTGIVQELSHLRGFADSFAGSVYFSRRAKRPKSHILNALTETTSL
jgi:hypothetical protein